MKFGGSRVYHLSCTSSDHVPILISLSGLSPPTPKKKISIQTNVAFKFKLLGGGSFGLG